MIYFFKPICKKSKNKHSSNFYMCFSIPLDLSLTILKYIYIYIYTPDEIQGQSKG